MSFSSKLETLEKTIADMLLPEGAVRMDQSDFKRYVTEQIKAADQEQKADSGEAAIQRLTALKSAVHEVNAQSGEESFVVSTYKTATGTPTAPTDEFDASLEKLSGMLDEKAKSLGGDIRAKPIPLGVSRTPGVTGKVAPQSEVEPEAGEKMKKPMGGEKMKPEGKFPFKGAKGDPTAKADEDSDVWPQDMASEVKGKDTNVGW